MKKKRTTKEPEAVEEGEIGTEERLGIQGQDTRKAILRRMIANIRYQLDQMERLMASEAEEMEEQIQSLEMPDRFESIGNERVIEGVFDGEHMVGEDGERYNVPPNYASKSKLVEGDLLRLAITEDGRLLFKQRGPIERQRLIGSLMLDERANEWKVVADGRKYRVLTASITFFRAQPGDEVAVLIPLGTPSHWAAIENIVKRGGF